MEPVMALAMVAPGDGGLMYLDTDPNYTWELKGSDLNTLSPFYKLNEKDFVRFVLPETEVDINTVSGNVKVTPINRTQYKKFSMSLVHILQIGDFYMRDGSLVGKDAELTDEQKANCIGIVFQTDLSRIGEAETSALNNNPHGLVVALKEDNYSHEITSKVMNWGIIPDDGIKEIDAISTTKADCYNDISGLKNTLSIWNKDGVNIGDYPALKCAKDFRTEVPVPNNCTGWFLPSAGQWWDIFRYLGECEFLDGESIKTDGGNFSWNPLPNGKKNLASKLNSQLLKIGEDRIHKFNDRGFAAYWTSSEFSYDYSRYVMFTENQLNIKAADKTTNTDYRVRCILAF